MKSDKKIFSLSLFISSLLCGPLSFSMTNPSQINRQLASLEEKAASLSAYRDKSPMGLIERLSASQFESAEQSFRESEFIATVRNLNSVLNQMHELDQERYLKAHYLLGRSYEELAYPSRAIKAYLRYLSSYASQAGGTDAQLIEVIRRLLLLDENSTQSQRDALQRLLASLMSLKLNADLKAQVNLLSSIAAYHAGRYRLADTWLKKLRDPQSPQQTQAEAIFYEALNKLAMGADTEGENLLLEASAFKEPAFLLIRDLSALNLARLYSARNMPQHAWEWYRKVEGPGASLRYAAYEGVLLLLQNREFDKSLQLAKTFISQYPQTQEAYNLKEKISFLKFQSGDLDPAEGDLRTREQALIELQSQFLSSYRTKERPSGPEVRELKEKTEIFAIQSPLLNTSEQLFKRLDRLSLRLSDQRQELNSSIFTLGRVIDSSLRPDVATTNQHYREVVGQLFVIGDSLVQFEQSLYSAQLSAAQNQQLARSMNRRKQLDKLEQAFQKGNWREWDNFSRLQIRLDSLQSRIVRSKAQLQAIKHFGRQGQAALKDYSSQAHDMLLRLQNQEELVSKQMREARIGMLRLIRSPSPFQSTRKELLLGAQEYIETISLFENYRDSFNNPMHQHQQEDTERAWLRWQKLAGKILSMIKQEEATQAQWIDTQLASIRSLMAREQELSERHKSTERRLSESTGLAMPAILDHFDYHISEQKSRGKKWLADLQWQRFMVQTETRMKKTNDQEESEAKIKENLKDIEFERSIHE